MNLRSVRRVLLGILLILVIAAGTAIWWFVYRPLPQVDGTIVVNGLHSDVSVERDRWGVPHIRAGSAEDMVEAQGYVMAQDRLWQMDLLRRIGRGQLSEIFGPVVLSVDKKFRTLGFGRAAEREAAAASGESRAIVEAYARGVNKFIERHQNQLPLEFSLLHYKPQPWTPADTFVIGGYMYATLADTWERELDRAKVTEHVGLDRAKDLFSQEAAMDHFIVGDPNDKKDGSQHAHSGDDDDDDDEMESDDVIKAQNLKPGTPGEEEIPPGIASMLWPVA